MSACDVARMQSVQKVYQMSSALKISFAKWAEWAECSECRAARAASCGVHCRVVVLTHIYNRRLHNVTGEQSELQRHRGEPMCWEA